MIKFKDRGNQILAMDSEQIYNGIKTGEVTCEEFEYWLDDHRANAYSDGYDAGCWSCDDNE